MVAPWIDHVVVDVQDRIEDAARRYRALGFHLTERGRHTLGSVNHLAMFDPDYLELLGSGDPGTAPRPELAGFPLGLNGLVFKLEDAAAKHAELKARGMPVLPVQSFSRPVTLPDGRREEARFHTVRLQPRAVFDGRVYFCEHLTPELVWRPEWQNHPNGALSIARVVLSVREPARIAGAFERMFGPGAVDPGGRRLMAGKVVIELALNSELARQLGHALADPAGRQDYMALLGIRVRSLSRTEATLRANGIRGLRRETGRILVEPAEAMNVALEFIE